MSDRIVPAEPIHVPEEVLADLRARLRATRWPAELPGTAGLWGPGLERMQRLCARWADGYDWRATEARVNRWPQFRTVIDGVDIHFFWLRSHEIIPESHRKGHEAFATGGLMLGFVLMMVLDTALG